MSILQTNAAPAVRLSGAWVDLAEAITWVQTRNIAVTKEARRADPVEAGVSLVLSGADVLMSQNDAEVALLEALRHGDVAAKGRRGTMRSVPDGSTFEAISDAEWCSLCFGHAGRFHIARTEPGSAGLEIWHDLLFEARGLTEWLPAPRLFGSLAVALAGRMPTPALQIEHMPADDEASARPVASSAAPDEPGTIEHEADDGPMAQTETGRPPSDASARRAFEKIVAEWRGASEPFRRPSLKEAYVRLMQELPGITENRVRKLWAELAPEEWRKKGPRGAHKNSAEE